MRNAILCLALLASVAQADAPPPWIVTPDIAPAPPAPPDPVASLAADELYVLNCKEPCFSMVAPAGVVSVSQAPGPVTMFSKFYGGGGRIEWKTFPGPSVIVVRAASVGGRANLTVIKVGAQTPADVFSQAFDVGPPVPPVPPVPPTPPPGPAPIPDPGLRVLMVYETAELSKLPPSQLAALYSTGMRAYLSTACVKGADGKTPEWRCWDQNTPTDLAPDVWKRAMARPRTSLPWLIVSNGKAGYEGPMPLTEEEVRTKVKLYEGR